MPDLFYCPHLSSSPVTLTGAEAHHALHVLRLKPGAAVDLFDGQGQTVAGTVAAVSRRDVSVEFSDIVRHVRRTQRIRVAAAIPKGDRLKWMVEKLTEIGVAEFIPLQTERGVVKPGDTKLEKLSATVVAACKQSRTFWLMSISRPTSLAEVLAAADCGELILAHPRTAGDTFRTSQSEGLTQPAIDRPTTPPATQTLLIGPEGGFTTTEVESAITAGGRLLDWPRSILRIETAALVFAAQLMCATSSSDSSS